ncbi:MAG: ATP-binding protein [Chloroflexota bacterium]
MNPLFDPIFTLLTTSPGNLIYHIVLAFSIAGSLQSAIHHWRTSEFPQARRAVLGLSLLLLAQVTLFIVSALGWQGFLEPQNVLPILDRAFIVMSLSWFIWLWAFPEPSRLADAGTALLNLLAGVAFVFSLISWGQRPASVTDFNGSTQDLFWQVFSLALILLGAAVLFLRKPNGWGNAVALLILAALGHAVYLLVGQAGDYSGAIRLAYMAAYPILLTLVQRFPSTPSRPTTVKTSEEQVVERRRYSSDPKTMHAMLALAAELDEENIAHGITRSVAQAMLADLCFLIYLADDNKLHIASGFDLIREENLPGTTLSRDTMPLLASAVQRARPLRLPASSTSPDLKGLSELLGLNNPGHLLNVPILDPQGEPLGSLLLLSPYSNRVWNAEDQTFLQNISTSFVPVILRGQRVGAVEKQQYDVQRSYDHARIQLQDLERQNEELAKKLENAIRQAQTEQVDNANVEALLAVQQESQRTIEKLQSEVETLKARKAAASDQQLEHELRLTLEQVAHLQNLLAQANMRMVELESQHVSSLSVEQAEIIASISQELRQPMSSIVGYTDLLLGESVGILGALQRKFVERIKASTERIGSLIDDLIQITTIESGLMSLKPEPIDLNLIIDNAMAYTGSQMREKNISMQLDLPKSMDAIYADREAVQQILIHLLQNAGAATPVEGTITLRVRTQKEDRQDFVLIQVTDTGGGIPTEDLSRVFSRLYRADNVLIQGIGDTGVGLSIARTLTEAQSGRIWVDTTPGQGSTFSVLLPLADTKVPRAVEGE